MIRNYLKFSKVINDVKGLNEDYKKKVELRLKTFVLIYHETGHIVLELNATYDRKSVCLTTINK